MAEPVKTTLHRVDITTELQKIRMGKSATNSGAVYESSLINYGGVRIAFEGDTYAKLFPDGNYPDTLLLEYDPEDISLGIKIIPYKK